MKRQYYLGIITSLIACGISTAVCSSPHNPLEIQIKPKTHIVSGLTSSYIKLATVVPITDGEFFLSFSNTTDDKNAKGNETFKDPLVFKSLTCQAGYHLVDGNCVDNECEGYTLNSNQLSNCGSTDTCLSGSVYKYKCESCVDSNMTLSNGVCSCSISTYPYGTGRTTCSHGYNQAQSCTETKFSGGSQTFYKACTCPSSYTLCNGNNEAGSGDTCTLDDKTYYENCACPATYSTTCEGNSIPTNSNDYCLNTRTNTTYYQSCTVPFSCLDNEVIAEEYWCNHDWVDFPSLK